jgi:hypothetical protein
MNTCFIPERQQILFTILGCIGPEWIAFPVDVRVVPERDPLFV